MDLEIRSERFFDRSSSPEFVKPKYLLSIDIGPEGIGAWIFKG